MRQSGGLVFILLLGTVHAGWCQFSGYNIAEYQFGNIPGTEPRGVNSIYDQFSLEYRLKDFRISGRIENYYSSDSSRDHYSRLSQYSFMYRKKGIDLKLGHFFETLGKGLLYRGYEIKNSVYENQIYRVKQAFYRDLRGASGSYANKIFEIKALHGRSLINDLPPTDKNNRLDLVSAVETKVRFVKQSAGIIYLQNKNSIEKSKYISFILGGNLFKNLDYYGEFAHRIKKNNGLLNFNEDDSYGAYLSINYSISGFGLSFELKDYHNLFIGSGISDPPTLVKEHSYRLLNRSTHVPFYFDESGIQMEAYIVPSENHMLTLNYSRSRNDLGEKGFISEEYFADWQFYFDGQNQVKIFVDYSSDEVLFENARYATGLYYTRTLQGKWSASIESEIQRLERTFSEREVFYNVYGGLILNYSTRFSAAIIFEYTDDSKFADIPGTSKVEPSQIYPGANFSFKPNRKNTIQLFAGKRRGGPACTSGICYEVLDFKGVELRWSKRF